MTTTTSTGRSSSLNKYKVSRRGRKLQISDDQRTLLALPRDVPERTWAEILQKEENDLVCFDIREEILEEALKIGYEHYMEKQNALFTTHCVAQAWLKLIDWHFYRHDPGEDPSAYPPCFIPKRVESWQPDDLPAASAKDTFAKQDLVVIEDSPDEPFKRWPSSESLDTPVIDDIPKEYWFPGKVMIYSDEEEEFEPGATSAQRMRKHRRKKPLVRPYGVSGVWDYIDSISSETISASADLIDESEVLQKVTDYSTVDTTPKESVQSGLKVTTPVDGSLHGAGDSTVGIDKLKSKRSMRKFDKSRSAFSKPSMGVGSGRSKGVLPPLDGGDSRSRISVISDCRLRNLRLDTQFEVASERMDTPPGETAKRK